MRAPRHTSAIRLAVLLGSAVGLVLLGWQARAGGPLVVGSPTMGVDGQPILWNPAAMPVQYRVDGGPLSRRADSTVVIPNATGVTRVQSMFQVWQDVPTSTITYANAGPIQSAGTFTDGDVDTAVEFDAVVGSCEAGSQSPIIFDADGNLFSQLVGDPSVIGFAGPCAFDPAAGYIQTGMAVMNGVFLDGVDSGSNYELTPAEFDQAFVHEFGHFSGIDHSQINLEVLGQNPGSCAASDLAGLPLMFPVLFCQARVTSGLPALAVDDAAWISRLYPETVSAAPTRTPFASSYGFITGRVLFSDGVTAAQGVNVIARRVDNPGTPTVNESRSIAFSVVSGYLFTGFIGQNVTSNSPPSDSGSRNPQLIGTFEIPVLPGTYRVEVESIEPFFAGGSSVGPLSFPIPSPGPKEFWNSGESATDSPAAFTDITVTAGATVSGIDIILNGTPSRFDSFESAQLEFHDPPPALLRRESLLAEALA